MISGEGFDSSSADAAGMEAYIRQRQEEGIRFQEPDVKRKIAPCTGPEYIEAQRPTGAVPGRHPSKKIALRAGFESLQGFGLTEVLLRVGNPSTRLADEFGLVGQGFDLRQIQVAGAAAHGAHLLFVVLTHDRFLSSVAVFRS